MASVFISYKRKDLKRVQQLVGLISESLCVECWIDIDGIESSAEFESRICTAIDNASVVLFMYSKNHLGIDFEEDYTIKELNYAKMTKKPIILVHLDNTALYNVFLFNFGSKNNIDANDPVQLEKLLDDLRTILKLPQVSSRISPSATQKSLSDRNALASKRVDNSSTSRSQRPQAITIPSSFSTKPGDYSVSLQSVGDKHLTLKFLSSLPGITPELANDYIKLAPLNVIRNVCEQDAQRIVATIEQLGGRAVAVEESKPESKPFPVATNKSKASSNTGQKRTSSSHSKGKEYSVVLQSAPNLGSVGRILSLLSGSSWSLNLLNLPLVIHKTTSYENAMKWKKRLEFVGAKVKVI